MADTSTAPTAVIGARGFIGSRLSNQLIAAGIPTTDTITTDSRPRTVYFVAGSVTPSSAERHPERVAAHLASFREMLDILAGTATRVVLAGSGGTIYDEHRRPPYRESSPVAPTSAYGHAKLAMEHELLTRTDIAGVVLRLANVYGPGQRANTGQGVVACWLDAVATNRPLVVYGDPEATRDYVYVDDVVDAMLRVRRAGPLPSVLNIGSGVPVTLSALVHTVEKAVAGHPLDIRFEPGRWFDRRNVWLDATLAGSALGWSARTGIEDGVDRTWLARSHAHA